MPGAIACEISQWTLEEAAQTPSGASKPMTAHRRLAGAGSRPQSGACLEAGTDGWPLSRRETTTASSLPFTANGKRLALGLDAAPTAGSAGGEPGVRGRQVPASRRNGVGFGWAGGALSLTGARFNTVGRSPFTVNRILHPER